MFAVRALRPATLLRPRAFHTSAPRCVLQPQIDLGRRLTLTDYTVQLMTASNSGHFGDCLQLAQRMKDDNIKPDLTVYNVLMSFAARDRNWLFAWAIFDDMILTGVKPTPTTLLHLIYAQAERPHINLWNAIDRMHQLGIKPTAPIYTAIIECCSQELNTESALTHFLAMKKEGIIPELTAAQNVISMVAGAGLVRVAIELGLWFETVSNRRLESHVWMGCLHASAEQLYIDGVLKCWPLVTNELNLVPTEMVSTAVLNTAARNGNPELATEALRLLQVANIEWKDYHFGALIEAFCRNDQVKEALLTLPIMKAGNITPTSATTSFLLDFIKRDVASLDAAWSIIDEIHGAGQAIDVDCLKVIIEASIHLGDLQRAVGIYKSFGEYKLTPDLATFNLLLDGCIGAQHRQLGDLLIEDMKESHIKPDSDTFEKMIQLCLTQDVYEDAFYYLEEMKAGGFIPPASVYEAMLQKTLAADDTRSSLVLQEMQECGYKPQDTRSRTAATALHVNKKRRAKS